jgi:tetratricopeptide (TPR) repeat protein
MIGGDNRDIFTLHARELTHVMLSTGHAYKLYAPGEAMDSATQMSVEEKDLTDALRRVAADPVFARSPQLRRLLEYLVTCAISGDSHPKEYTIAVEALGRSADFDPERDAIVRVQAGRLRRALDKYYAGPGGADRVRITLPAGSYVIACHYQTAAAPTQAPRRHGLGFAAFAGVLVLIAIAFMLPAFRNGVPPSAPPVRTSATNGLPTIVIMPISGPAADIDSPSVAGLRRRIASAFSQFETVNVVYVARPPSGQTLPEQHASDGERVYFLSAVALPQNDDIRLQFQLGDQSVGAIAWTQAFNLPRQDEAGVKQEQISRRLATTLLQPFGVIAARERAYQKRTGAGDPRYRCVLEASDALRDASEDGYRNARACLQRVVDIDPQYTLAHAYLALILNRYFQYGLSSQSNALAEALDEARHAIQTNPTSARAHFALFVTRFNMRAFDDADTAMAQARALNDNDPVMQSEYGGRLIAAGRVDEGMAILDAVDDAFPARSCSHGLYIFLGHYIRGEWPAAQRRADEITCSAFGFAYVARALLAVHDSDREAARRMLDSVASLLAGWRSDRRAALSRVIPDAAIVERILRDLAAVDAPARD